LCPTSPPLGAAFLGDSLSSSLSRSRFFPCTLWFRKGPQPDEPALILPSCLGAWTRYALTPFNRRGRRSFPPVLSLAAFLRVQRTCDDIFFPTWTSAFWVPLTLLFPLQLLLLLQCRDLTFLIALAAFQRWTVPTTRRSLHRLEASLYAPASRLVRSHEPFLARNLRARLTSSVPPRRFLHRFLVDTTLRVIVARNNFPPAAVSPCVPPNDYRSVFR